MPYLCAQSRSAPAGWVYVSRDGADALAHRRGLLARLGLDPQRLEQAREARPVGRTRVERDGHAVRDHVHCAGLHRSTPHGRDSPLDRAGRVAGERRAQVRDERAVLLVADQEPDRVVLGQGRQRVGDVHRRRAEVGEGPQRGQQAHVAERARLQEEAAVVLMDVGLEEQDLGDVGAHHLHGKMRSFSTRRRYSPYPLDEMTVSLWTGTTGRLDKVPTEDVLRFEREFLDFLRREHEGGLSTIRESRDFTEDTEHALEEAYNKFLDQFETSDGQSIKAGKEEHEALPEDELEQEQIVKQKRG